MCYFDTDFETPSIWEKRWKKGNVMAMMYANFHNFMDGQTGIRVEEGGTLTVSFIVEVRLIAINGRLSCMYRTVSSMQLGSSLAHRR